MSLKAKLSFSPHYFASSVYNLAKLDNSLPWPVTAAAGGGGKIVVGGGGGFVRGGGGGKPVVGGGRGFVRGGG